MLQVTLNDGPLYILRWRQKRHNISNQRELYLTFMLKEKPFLDGILPSSVSNLRGDYHNPLPAKLVHTQKINLRRLVICWKTRW